MLEITMENYDYDHLFKFLIIGDSNVGKSCLLIRFSDDNFTESFDSTIGIDFNIKTIIHNNKIIKIHIWDCAGQERFRSIVASYYKGAHGIILAYSVANRDSFDNIKQWYVDCQKYCNQNANFVLVGTKSDLEKKRVVLYTEGEKLAKELNMNFMETSAKNNIGVTGVFENLVKLSIGTIDVISTHNTTNTINKIKPIKISNHKKCCTIL